MKMPFKLSKPAKVYAVASAISVIAVIAVQVAIAEKQRQTGQKPKGAEGQAAGISLAFAAAAVLGTYLVNCTVRGDCNRLAWVLTVINMLAAAVYVVVSGVVVAALK